MNQSAEERKSEADWLAAFGEPTRLTILRALAIEEKSITGLAVICRVEAINLLHHLRILKAAGIVKDERAGRLRRYSLAGAKATATELEIIHESGTKISIALA